MLLAQVAAGARDAALAAPGSLALVAGKSGRVWREGVPLDRVQGARPHDHPGHGTPRQWRREPPGRGLQSGPTSPRPGSVRADGRQRRGRPAAAPAGRRGCSPRGGVPLREAPARARLAGPGGPSRRTTGPPASACSACGPPRPREWARKIMVPTVGRSAPPGARVPHPPEAADLALPVISPRCVTTPVARGLPLFGAARGASSPAVGTTCARSSRRSSETRCASYRIDEAPRSCGLAGAPRRRMW